MKLSQSQVYAVAVAAGLPNPKLMAAIAMAESGGDTNVVNSIGCVGLWQINQPVHVKAHPTWTQSWLKNPLNNATAAKTILKTQGLGAWEVYTGADGKGSDGSYREFINAKIETAGIPTPWDPFGLIPTPGELFGTKEPWETIPDIPGMDSLDSLGAVTDALGRTADVLVNPRTWLRVAYGITGVVLVVGGLLLVLRNTSAVKNATAKVESVANVTPIGRAATVAKSVKKGAS